MACSGGASYPIEYSQYMHNTFNTMPIHEKASRRAPRKLFSPALRPALVCRVALHTGPRYGIGTVNTTLTRPIRTHSSCIILYRVYRLYPSVPSVSLHLGRYAPISWPYIALPSAVPQAALSLTMRDFRLGCVGEENKREEGVISILTISPRLFPRK